MELDLERQLLQHARSVQSLASALLGDAAAGQDVAQQTVLLARDQRPPATSLRAWMLRVGRRLAGRWRRTEHRRQQRERAAAQPDRQPSAADEAQRAELLQAIADAVTALPPAWREVVLLRHYDGLPPRVVAARLQLSVEAVESRLRRAHAQLRLRLQQHAPADWRTGLMLFAVPGAWTPLPGAVAVSAKSKCLVAAAALLLCCGGWLLWPRSAPDARPDAEAPPIAAVPGAEPRSNTLSAAPRTDATPAAQATRPHEPRPTWTAMLTGRVVDTHRHPVAAAPITAQLDDGARAEAISDASGHFTIALLVHQAWRCSGEVTAVREDLAGIASFAAWKPMSAAIDVGTLVLDATGSLDVDVRRGAATLAGARVVAVRAVHGPGLRRAAEGDEHGRATLRGLCPNRYLVAAVAADDSWVVGEVDVLPRRTARLDLDLLATTPVEVLVRARGGQPIAGATLDVLFELDAASMPVKLPLRLLVPMPRTDADGRAHLLGLCRGQLAGVGATHPDWRPTLTWNAPPVDWSTPRVEVELDGFDTATWQLVDGEVPVPPDGTMFQVLETQVPLRQGRLCFDGQPLVSGMHSTTLAVGPGCCALLPVPATGPVPLRRAHRLVVEVRDANGRACVDWPLAIWAAGPSMQSVRTDAEGRAVAEGLPAGAVTVNLDGAAGMQEIGKAQVGPGDGLLAITRSLARSVRAQVYIDGRRGLPGDLQLGGDGYIDNLHEDADGGELTFDLWPNDADRACQLGLGTPGLSPGRAKIEPGSGPAQIEFRLQATGSGTIDLVPPPDGVCQIRVERFYRHDAGGWWGFAGQVRSTGPQRLWSLTAGRYRLHDQLSDITGPEVEVVADGVDAQLTLDLSRVVPVRGRVTANTSLTDVAVELRDRDATALQRHLVDADGVFALRVALDRPGLVLVAVRGSTVSPPLPVTGAMADLQIVLPQ